MAVVTDEDFEFFLDEELSWRRIELQALGDQLTSAARKNESSPLSRALSRGMTTLLYAHWEGYSKAVFEAYFKLVMRRKPRAAESSDGLLLAHTVGLVRRSDAGDSGASSELLELARGSSSSRLRLVQGRIVDTKSNLRFDALENIMEVFGMPMSAFSTKRNLIDVLLCDRRNDIAHGRANFPDHADVMELHDQVLEMMETMRDLVIAHVRRKAYRVDAS